MVEAAPAEEAAEAEAADAGAPEAAAEAPVPPGAVVASVGETPARTVELLVAAGLDAELLDGAVIVYGGSEQDVLDALGSVPGGDVPVYLAPPR